MLTEEVSYPESPEYPKTPKPPPIFVHGVINYKDMIKSITEVAEEEQFYTKTLANDVIKLSSTSSTAYRTIVKRFRENNIYFHTYQLKEERTFRVVLKHLHYTTDTDDIKKELLDLGNVVRNITNVRHRQTKEPLNLFFIDLEPATNNKDIYNLTAIQNRIIHFEPPRSHTNIPQCTRCQQYGHMQRYCNKPYACVKCSGQHNTSNCTKSHDTPAKCVLCGGSHLANYKGCPYYRSILNGYNPHRQNHIPRTPTSPSEQTTTPNPINPLQPQHQHQCTYANVVSSNVQPTEGQISPLQSFLDGFKTLITKLIQQNDMILTMLTTLINKHR
jgi:hypothetical protein